MYKYKLIYFLIFLTSLINQNNTTYYFLAYFMIRYLILSLLMIVSCSQRQIQQVFYNWQLSQFRFIEQRLLRVQSGYFVELGGYNPIELSNTALLSNWKGLIVEANQQRANNLRDYHMEDITVLNFAMTKKSGTMIKFFQNSNPGQSTASQEAGKLRRGSQKEQLEVMTINLADLCHKYYKQKPIFMSIDLQGSGQTVLQSNDWKTQKCFPDIIFAEVWPNSFMHMTPQNRTLKQQLESLNYTTVVNEVDMNSLFIHNSKLQFYNKQSSINMKSINNMNLIPWINFCGMLSRIFRESQIDAYCSQQYKVRTAPFYIKISHSTIIDIEAINNHSNFVSQSRVNRPIFIMEYDQNRNKIKLPTKQYQINQLKIQFYTFKVISIQVGGKQLKIYVFDHQKYDDFQIIFDFPSYFNLQKSPQVQKIKELVKNPNEQQKASQVNLNKQINPNTSFLPQNKASQESQQITANNIFLKSIDQRINEILIGLVIISLAIIGLLICLLRRSSRLNKKYQKVVENMEVQNLGFNNDNSAASASHL